MSVYSAVKAFIDSRRDIIAPSTLYGYETILNNRLQDIMTKKISELKILDVQAAVNADHRDKHSSHKTLKSALSLINSALVVQGFDYHLTRRITIPAPKAKKPDLPTAAEVIKAIKGTEVRASVYACDVAVAESVGSQRAKVQRHIEGRLVHNRLRFKGLSRR